MKSNLSKFVACRFYLSILHLWSMSRKILAKLNKITEVVKQEGRITFASLCVKCDIAPSTLYGYVPMLVEMFEWIQYKDREFVAIV